MSEKIKKQHRFSELDALRGFAAIATGIWHTSIMVIPHGFINGFDGVSILNMEGISTELYLWRLFLSVCNGPIAVNMFFILSGFVLYGMLKTEIGSQDIWSGVKRFYVRRIVRLYIPIFFAVTFIYIVSITFGAYLGLIHHPIHDYLSNIVLGGRRLDMVTWTVKIEILASILFPLIYLVHNAVNKYLLMDLLILLFFIYLRVESPDRSLQSFLFMFYLGMMIHSLGLPSYAKETNNLLLYFGILAYFILVLFAGAILNLGHSASFDLVSGVGLAGLIYAVAFRSSGTLLSRVLSSRVAQFYGKISYSYYLLHILLVYVSLNLLLNHMSVATDLDYIFTMVVISTVVIIITTIISWVFSIFVEQPAINISRRLAKSMRIAAINKSVGIKQ